MSDDMSGFSKTNKLDKDEFYYSPEGYIIFTEKYLCDAHAVLAMYHDQGLIPLKLLASGGGVNFTANLSIVRVSPDHGTAFPIAGKNIADPQSTLEAIVAGINISLNNINLLL